MKREDLLRAVTEISETYILEAEPKETSQVSSERSKTIEPVVWWKRYVRIAGAAAAVLLVFLGVLQIMNSGMLANHKQNVASTESVQEDGASAITSKTENVVPTESMEEEAEFEPLWSGIANPWVSCGSLEEAEELTGFSLEVPRLEEEKTYTQQEISVMEDSLIEIRYLDAQGIEGYRIRKGSGIQPLDGDYEVYDNERTIEIDNHEVTLRGNGTAISVAVWIKNDFSYAVTAGNHTFTEEEIVELVQEIK